MARTRTMVRDRERTAIPVVPPAPQTAIPGPPTFPIPLWGYLAGFGTALVVLFIVYWPAINGQFVFDDLFLPYSRPNAVNLPLRAWLGIRPVLGLSFWSDSQFWGMNTFGFHVTNLLLHFASSVVLFFLLRKVLALGSTADPVRTILSSFGAALFLLHPLQTEVAAYIASRSEAMSVLFFLSAMTVFLYRRTVAIDWPFTAAVLVLFALALGSKEHTVTLPALLLLTDYFWNPGFSFAGIRANARLYLLLVVFGAIGGILVLAYIASDPMIGFHIKDLGPGAYFLTQCRAIFKYVQLFVFPVAQNVDHDFTISQGITEHGALFAVAGLVFLTVAAFLFRREYPFAAYGIFAFLLLLSPTSSFIPINDVFAERRVYLPFFALILIVFEPLRRIRSHFRLAGAVLATLCVICAVLTWERAHVWTNVLTLFQDASIKSPNKPRVHVGYANALYHQGRCLDAITEYEAAARVKAPDYLLYYNMAAAYDCAKLPDLAITVLNKSIELEPKPNAYVFLGRLQSRKHQYSESIRSFQSSIELDPRYTPAYVNRAAVYIVTGQLQAAYGDYKQTLFFEPQNQQAQQGLAFLARQR